MSRKRNSYSHESKHNLESQKSKREACCFCNLTEDDELQYGKFHKHNNIFTHYYCLLLSSNMAQKGKDEEGILGFLVEDIQKELRRGKRLICTYCKKNGATLGCCNIKCRRKFHYPCGLKAGSLHQFFGGFRSFCIDHRPKQKIDNYIIKEIRSSTVVSCYICYENVKPKDFLGTLWASCCKKNTWFHRKCVQQLALSAGYFFKCPLCNNKRDFQKAMKKHGIFIPSQDASWELVPNAFEELLYRHNQCDAKVCHCPKGRKYTSKNAKWELVLCRTCGSQGIHIACGQLKWANPVWECSECTSILRNIKEQKTALLNDNSNSSSQSNDFDSDDTDISVGTECLTLVPSQCPSSSSSVNLSVKLRPGPRSFKLQQQVRANITSSIVSLSTSKLSNIDSKESTVDTVKEESNLTKDRSSSGNEKVRVLKKQSITHKSDDDEDYVYSESDEDDDDDDDDDYDDEDEDDDEDELEDENKNDSSNNINNDDDDDDVTIIALKRINPETTQVSTTNPSRHIVKPNKIMEKSSVSALKHLQNKKKFINLPQTNEKTTISELEDLKETIDGICMPKPLDLLTPQYASCKGNNFKDMSDGQTPAMNIKIVNVTSLSPEVFASVPDVGCDKTDTCLQEDLSEMSFAESESSISRCVTPILITKRGTYKEVIDLEDNRHKRLKINSLSEALEDVNNTNQRQARNLESAVQNNKIQEINVDDLVSKRMPLESTDPLSIPEKSLFVQFKDSLSESNETTAQLLIQPNKMYFKIPSSDNFYAEQIPISANEMKSDFHTRSHNGIMVCDQPAVNTQSVIPNVINLDDDAPPEVSNKHSLVDSAKTWHKDAYSYDHSLNNNLCEGDAGRTSPAVTTGDPICEHADKDDTCDPAKPSNADANWRRDSANKSCGRLRRSFKRKASSKENDSVHAKLIVPCARSRSIFPRVTNNRNTCHQPRLIPQYIYLHDLEFQVHGSDVQMILYDTFSVNIPLHKFSRGNRIKPSAVTAQKSKESAHICQTRGETSSSLDCYDSTVSNTNNDKTKRITDVTVHDDAKENLDPVMRTVSRDSVLTEASLVNGIDDIAMVNDCVCESDSQVKCVSSDTNLSASNRIICNAKVDSSVTDEVMELVPNDRNQGSRVSSEDVQYNKQLVRDTSASADERIGSRLFCNRTIHCRSSDLNIVNKNKSIERSLQRDVAVSTNQHADDDKYTGNDCTDDYSMLDSNNLSCSTRSTRRWNSVYARLDGANVVKSKARNVINASNKQITGYDSRFVQGTSQRDALKHHTDGDIRCKINSSVKVSIDLQKIYNLIRTKPNIFTNELFYNDDNDDNNQCYKRMKRICDDYTQQQQQLIKYHNTEKKDPFERASFGHSDLLIPICNIEKVQTQERSTDVKIFDRCRKQTQGSRPFKRRILNK